MVEIGDRIEVTGSKIICDDKPAIVATRVVNAGKILEIRDELGFPAWRGWRRGAKP
jgi:hypothetical protein